MSKEEKMTKDSMFEQFKKIFEKINLVIEFIAVACAMYSVYMIYVFRTYSQIWPLKYILILVPMLLISIGVIIYNCVKHKKEVEKIFVSFLIVSGMMYVFFMAPGYAPDENAHIWKSYEVSTGKLITPINESKQFSTEIPVFFELNRIPYIKSYSQFEEAKNKDTNYEGTKDRESPARTYPATLYIVSSIGFLIGRIFNINGIFAIYLARMLNFIVFLISGYYSIKLLPFGKKILGVIMFFPMTLQQAASVSADSILNSLLFIYIAYTFYLCKMKEKLSVKQKIMYVTTSVLISISKIAYVPLTAISACLILRKQEDKKGKIIFVSITIIVSVIAALGWYKFSSCYPEVKSHKIYIEQNNVNAKEQIKSIIHNPSNFLIALKQAFSEGLYLNTTIGSSLGWLNIGVPSVVLYIFIMLLIVSPFLDENKIELERSEKIWTNLIALGTYMLVILAMYITWTDVGAKVIKGVQGRYFIPVLALPLLTMCGKEKNIAKSKYNNITVAIISVLLNCVAISEVAKFFVQ